MLRPPKTDYQDPRRIAALEDLMETDLKVQFPNYFAGDGAVERLASVWSKVLAPWTAQQILDATPNVLRERRKMGMVQPAEIDEWLKKHTSTASGGGGGKEPRWMEDYEARKAKYRARYTDQQLIQMNRAMRPFDTMDPALEVVIGEAESRRPEDPEKAVPAEMVTDIIRQFREDVLKPLPAKSRKTLVAPPPDDLR